MCRTRPRTPSSPRACSYKGKRCQEQLLTKMLNTIPGIKWVSCRAEKLQDAAMETRVIFGTQENMSLQYDPASCSHMSRSAGRL